ncbi:MAG: hypothetical protein M1602_04445, partial [Firmicutes bacterium]|nr:hypothetical protein [Bacillota bacterium]
LIRFAEAEEFDLKKALALVGAQDLPWLPAGAEATLAEAQALMERLRVQGGAATEGAAGEGAAGEGAAGGGQEEALQQLPERLAALATAAARRQYDLERQIGGLVGEKEELQKALADLAQRRLGYNEHVTQLRRLITEDSRRFGSEAQPQVLCELLEIPNEKWQDAVEGYLNTQRFDLIVPPAAFDRALAVYEGRKREFKLHGVGLVNTGKVLEQPSGVMPGSLAEEVETNDPYARAYAARLLGQVMKCETEQELKRHRLAITPTCMTYRNHTARQIAPAVYAVPFIGERALRRQRELKEARLREVTAALEELRREQGTCRDLVGLLPDKRDRYTQMSGLWRQALRVPEAAARVQDLQVQLAGVDRRELDQIDAAIRQAQEEERQLSERIGLLQNRQGQNETLLKQLAQATPGVEADLAERRVDLERQALESPAAAERGDLRYQAERRRWSNAQVADRFGRNRTTNRSKLSNLRDNLIRLRSNYNRDYQFGGAVEAFSNDAYDDERQKLAGSELPSFREQIAKAREAAEQEFKEHFIHRLHEHLETAENAFDDLNKVLRGITFGSDRYEFIARATEEYRDYYKMIMDEFLMEGQSLFSQAFQDKYRETIDDLFRRMLDVPEEEQQHNIERLTDYRTYLDYDIRIHHAGGETTLFSKVSYEKSGGETQTPYYVAMIASYLQAYRLPYNPDAARLVLFDEAFNRMDPDRVENMLAFLNQLELQAIIAAPTDKCQLIAPYVPTTVLVMRNGRRVWLEDYDQVIGAGTAGGEAPSGTVLGSAGEVAAAAGDQGEAAGEAASGDGGEDVQ